MFERQSYGEEGKKKEVDKSSIHLFIPQMPVTGGAVLAPEQEPARESGARARSQELEGRSYSQESR